VWDNARLLNAAADWLLGATLVVLLYGAAQLVARSPLFALREVVVRGVLAHSSRAEIERAVAEPAARNFFAADLGAVRAALEALPWVRRAEVRRVWPDRVEVALHEHVALARWGDAGLVNTHGERFAARLDPERESTLPQFVGPSGSEAEVARRYRRFAAVLAPLGDAPARVVLSPRFAWQLQLASGLDLELGRDGAEPVEARLARFVARYGETLGRLNRRSPGGDARQVDLRYPNGFALRVPEWKG
jgi:cell division protein FtsQ